MSGIDVAEQSAYTSLFPGKTVVAEQSAYIVIVPGTRVSITEQSAYLGLFPPITNKKRRIIMTMTG